MSLNILIKTQGKLPHIALHLVPQVALLPPSIQRFDDPFLPFGKAVINASREHVSLYIFDVVAYFALGGAGAVALERTIDYLNDEIPCVLHGPFGDTSFAAWLDKLSFGASAITLGNDQSTTLKLIDFNKVAVGQWDRLSNTLDIEDGRLQVMGSELVYKSRRDDFQDVISQELR